MKKLASILLLSVLTITNLVGCGEKEVDNHLEQKVETEISGEVPSKDVIENKKIEPIKSVIDLNNIGNSILPVSLNYGDIYQNEDGEWKIRVNVYDYEKFKVNDIKGLVPGDTIVINNKEVLIDEIIINTTGSVFINGGLEKDGYDLYTDDGEVYYEHGYSDVKSYFSVGEIELELIENFVYIDESNGSDNINMFNVEDLDETMIKHEGHYTPHNTYLTTENGKGFELRIIYNP